MTFARSTKRTRRKQRRFASAQRGARPSATRSWVAEKEFSFGLRFVAGFKYFITERWAVTFELGYTFVPANDIIEHELSDSYLGAYFF